jgi:predicted acyltransferase
MNAPRLSSLDQFRGYTVLGMFLVNFVGGKEHVPDVLKHHHTYCSYADTIMPQFLLAVGFGMRLSFLRRRQTDGAAAYRHFAGRCLGLILLGIVVYHLTGGYKSWAELTAERPDEFLLKTFKRHPFEALTHIGVTALWVLPVLAAPGWVRVLFAAASAGLHVWASHAGYYQWNLTSPVGIDGGPLGFLTWTIPLVAGTLAHDWVTAGRGAGWKLIVAAAGLMAIGYGLSVQNPTATPPFVKPAEAPAFDYWLMSQRAGSVTYLLFAAGFALAVYAVFRVACDRSGVRWGYLDLLGRHALAGYVIHDMAAGAVQPFVPKDAPGWWVAVGFGVYLGVVTVFLRYLDRNRLYLKL